MPALTPQATPVCVDDLARLRVLEAGLEVLTAEHEILKHRLAFLTRQLAAAETRAAQETVKAQRAIAQFLALIRSVRDRPSSRLPTREAVREAAKTERRPRLLGSLSRLGAY
jgi:hypothetical protein